MAYKRAVPVLLAFTAVAAGFALQRNTPALRAAEPSTEPPVIEAEFDNQYWTGDIDGWARVYREASGGFMLSVRLDGLTTNEHPWHIHRGWCDPTDQNGGGDAAPVVVALTLDTGKPLITSPLKGDEDGVAEGAVTLTARQMTLDMLRTGPYSVHVHAPGIKGVEPPTMACANLR
jgi:hypothetical protein